MLEDGTAASVRVGVLCSVYSVTKAKTEAGHICNSSLLICLSAWASIMSRTVVVSRSSAPKIRLSTLAFAKRERERSRKEACSCVLGVFGVFGVFAVVENEPLRAQAAPPPARKRKVTLYQRYMPRALFTLGHDQPIDPTQVLRAAHHYAPNL